MAPPLRRPSTPIREGRRAHARRNHHRHAAPLAATDEAEIAFAVTSREPDRDVPGDELAWRLARLERAEIRAALTARSLR
jgi:hypothetical protein